MTELNYAASTFLRGSAVNFREEFIAFIKSENRDGSNRASSYIRAIELLDSILGRKAPKELNAKSIWSISSAEHIQSLYQLVLEHQKLGQDGIFKGEEPSSYWKQNFCSAALRSYREFLVTHLYEQKMWDVYQDSSVRPEELAERLVEQEIESAELLVVEQDLDLKSKTGKDAVREVKTRIGQGFFRKMILRQYNTQCCITGLNVQEVLRASHIVGWAEDEDNRMNPRNGLCLSATYDAAFDKHLISFDDDYRMILSPTLKEHCTNKAFQEYFLNHEGEGISKPLQHLPGLDLLEKHRQKMST
jgi:putative restriction endonuclease